ncbi:MAG: sigma 54-interacting transcriptional regulator [Acidobacteria bacterium]|nr:sigma 54-interacting transcriptional regulator [Acidobacteriota bacterium]
MSTRVRALRFVTGSGAREMSRELVTIDAERLQVDRGAAAPAAYVVRNADLESFRDLKGLVIDRGLKHEKKGLSGLLLGHQAIPLLTGSFRARGQLTRAVRTLLGNAIRRADRNVYLIGAPDDLFESLCALEDKEPPVVPLGREIRTLADEQFSAERILNLLSPYTVPPALERQFIGKSIEAQLVRQLIVRAAHHHDPTLIVGDTGTGKEVVARAIHTCNDHRRREHFLPVNCGAIPHDLFEAELFGYVPGAFTGALRVGKKGLWVAAGGGTLFLDEIGDMPLDMQVKVLRAIDTGRVRAVGGEQEVKVEARILAATNRDVFAMVQAGHFREDLYYRLRPFMIRTPALRDHPEDIPLLAQVFWREIVRDPDACLPAQVLGALGRHRWPGNARELRAVLVSLHGLFGKTDLTLAHLSAVFQLQGYPATDDVTRELDEVRRHRVDCLRHLRRADEVVRACKVVIEARMRRRVRDARPPSIEASLAQRITELDVLCQQPLLFHTTSAFSDVHRLQGDLRGFYARLGGDGKEATSYWIKTLSPQLRCALGTIMREVERILRKIQ